MQFAEGTAKVLVAHDQRFRVRKPIGRLLQASADRRSEERDLGRTDRDGKASGFCGSPENWGRVRGGEGLLDHRTNPSAVIPIPRRREWANNLTEEYCRPRVRCPADAPRRRRRPTG